MMTTSQRSALHALLADPVDLAGDNIRAIRALLARLDSAEQLLAECIDPAPTNMRDLGERIEAFLAAKE